MSNLCDASFLPSSYTYEYSNYSRDSAIDEGTVFIYGNPTYLEQYRCSGDGTWATDVLCE
jgi:hypothetical protein